MINRSSVISNFYKNVKQLVKENGFEFGKFERDVGLSPGYLSRTKGVSIDKVYAIAERLGTTIETLLDEPHTGNVRRLHDFFVKLAVDTSRGSVKWYWTHDGVNCNISGEDGISVLTIYEKTADCYVVNMSGDGFREAVYDGSDQSGIPYLDNAVKSLYEMASESVDTLSPYVRSVIDAFLNS